MFPEPLFKSIKTEFEHSLIRKLKVFNLGLGNKFCAVQIFGADFDIETLGRIRRVIGEDEAVRLGREELLALLE